MKNAKKIVSLLTAGVCCGLLFISCGQKKEAPVIAELPIQEKLQELIENIEIKTEETEIITKAWQTDIENRFYELAEEKNVKKEEAEEYLAKFLGDGIFQDGVMKPNELWVTDVDGNGQSDMIIRLLDEEARNSHDGYFGTGCIYFYMNEDMPYCFRDETMPFFGYTEIEWADIDNDGNVEIFFETVGTGNGGAGDWYVAVLKYENHTLKRMELPSDIADDYYTGVEVTVNMEPKKNAYSASCAVNDKIIQFEAENCWGEETILPEVSTPVGGNCRGYIELKCVEYEGENALQAWEYLYGEGGISHSLGVAKFIIQWNKNAKPYVADWQIESWD